MTNDSTDVRLFCSLNQLDFVTMQFVVVSDVHQFLSLLLYHQSLIFGNFLSLTQGTVAEATQPYATLCMKNDLNCT